MFGKRKTTFPLAARVGLIWTLFTTELAYIGLWLSVYSIETAALRWIVAVFVCEVAAWPLLIFLTWVYRGRRTETYHYVCSWTAMGIFFTLVILAASLVLIYLLSLDFSQEEELEWIQIFCLNMAVELILM
jgi:hypothetical protein